MKPAVILCMVALCAVPLEAEMNKAIYFHHIGMQNDPFTVIVIHTEGDEFALAPTGHTFSYEYCKVNTEVFGEIKTIIQESRLTIRVRDRRVTEYGSFEITIEEGSGKSYYYVSGIGSLRFFYELIKHLSRQKGLEWLIDKLDAAYFRRLIYIY